MNYQKIYDDLIARARLRQPPDYAERHHIVPRCLGGSDCSHNIVPLTPEEHYVAHQLLAKIHPGHPGLAKAAHMMCANRPTNKYYGWVRRRFAKAQSQITQGEGNPMFGTRLIHNPDLRETKRAKKDDPLPEGWKEGAVYNFDSYHEKLSVAEEKELQRQRDREEKVRRLRELHEIYNASGFDGVRKAGYTKSKANLVMQFARHLPEFVPQNGKKRGS